MLEGRRVIVVDDSIVRGTTSRKIVKMVRDAGAAEVHVRVSSPPTRWPCFYGIATPTRQELIASTQSEDSISAFLEADSVGYLSLGALARSVRSQADSPHRGENGKSGEADREIKSGEADKAMVPSGGLRGFCHACWSGEYPVAIPKTPQHRLRLVNG